MVFLKILPQNTRKVVTQNIYSLKHFLGFDPAMTYSCLSLHTVNSPRWSQDIHMCKSLQHKGLHLCLNNPTIIPFQLSCMCTDSLIQSLLKSVVVFDGLRIRPWARGKYWNFRWEHLTRKCKITYLISIDHPLPSPTNTHFKNS